MRILVLGGCGIQGRTAISDLARSEDVKEVICADANLDAFERIKDLPGMSKVQPEVLNAADPDNLADLFGRADAAIDLLPRHYTPQVCQAAIQTGVGSNVEARYFGLNNWDTSATFSTVASGNPTLYSIFSNFGQSPANGFDDTDRSFIHSISYNSEMHNGEVNFRRAHRTDVDVGKLGVRLDREGLDIADQDAVHRAALDDHLHGKEVIRFESNLPAIVFLRREQTGNVVTALLVRLARVLGRGVALGPEDDERTVNRVACRIDDHSRDLGGRRGGNRRERQTESAGIRVGITDQRHTAGLGGHSTQGRRQFASRLIRQYGPENRRTHTAGETPSRYRGRLHPLG